MSLSGMRNYQKRPSGVKRDLFTRKRALLTLANLRTVSMSLSISIMALLSLLCDSSSANDSCRCGMQEVSKEACSCGKRGLLYPYIWPYSPYCVTLLAQTTAAAAERTGVKRGLFMWQKRPTIYQKKRPAYLAKGTSYFWKKRVQTFGKETCLHGKRDLPIWQKRPAYMAKETCLHGKRDLPICQKIPAYMAKETCLFGKEAY